VESEIVSLEQINGKSEKVLLECKDFATEECVSLIAPRQIFPGLNLNMVCPT
jgi:hypothetical protein